MCCGDGPSLEEIVMAEEELEPVKVFTTTPGDVRRISTFGVATNDEPALVPPAVAAELASSTLFRLDPETTPQSAAEAAEAAAAAADPVKKKARRSGQEE